MVSISSVLAAVPFVAARQARPDPAQRLTATLDQVSLSPAVQRLLVAGALIAAADTHSPDNATTDHLRRLSAQLDTSQASGWSGTVAVSVTSADGTSYTSNTSASVTTSDAAAQVEFASLSSGTAPGGEGSDRGFIYTGAGNDTITASTNTGLTIDAKGGDNVITVHAAAPRWEQTGDLSKIIDISAGAGNDTISVNGPGPVDISTGDGDNLVVATGPNSAYAAGGGGNDTFDGVSSAWGGAGSDVFRNVANVYGGKGDDVIEQGNVEQLYVGFRPGDGRDSLTLSTGTDGAPAPHTTLDLRGTHTDDWTSSLRGTTLTLTLKASGEGLEVQNYQPGSITFATTSASSFDDVKSDTPPGLPAADLTA